MRDEIRTSVMAWLEGARARVRTDSLREEDLDELSAIVARPAARVQQLLYLHVCEPTVTSEVIGMAQHDPLGEPETLRTRADWPYQTVLDAVRDGWQVVHFPDQRSRFEERGPGLVGFEFILQRYGDNA